jgi:hypothetical protein
LPPHGRGQRLRTVVAAAAVVVVVGGAVVGIARASRRSPSAKASSASLRPSAGPTSTMPASALSGQSGTASPPATPPAGARDLGAYSSVDALKSTLRTLIGGGTIRLPAGQVPPPCDSRPGTPKLVASLRWQGRSALVVVYEGGASPGPIAAGPIAAVMSIPDCAPLVSFPL